MTDNPIPASSSRHKRLRWRNHIKIHPAAALFPLMDADELQKLANDIAQHGMNVPPVFFRDEHGLRLLDGRNRFDALELTGGFVADLLDSGYKVVTHEPPEDPFEIVVSLNILRRHLTREKKQELIDQLLIENPDRSSRETAALAKVSPTTVITRRQKLEAKGEIPKVTETVGKDGRIRTATPARSKTGKTAKTGLPGLPPTEEEPKPARAKLDEWRAFDPKLLQRKIDDLVHDSPVVRGAYLATRNPDFLGALFAKLSADQRAQWEAEMNAAQDEEEHEEEPKDAAPAEAEPAGQQPWDALYRFNRNLDPRTLTADEAQWVDDFTEAMGELAEGFLREHDAEAVIVYIQELGLRLDRDALSLAIGRLEMIFDNRLEDEEETAANAGDDEA